MTILTCNSCREPFSSRPNYGDIAIQCDRCIADPGWQERAQFVRYLVSVESRQSPNTRASLLEWWGRRRA